MESKTTCVSCNAETKLPVCSECVEKHSTAAKLYAVFCTEQVIPQPWTCWYWDAAMARSTWELALKCERYLKIQ